MKFTSCQTPGSKISNVGRGAWTLEIPPGPEGSYRLAQLDDYSSLARKAFPWQPPLILRLQARVSDLAIPGTWGFGFWNDPFSFSLGLGGGSRRFPALPNAAWFFFASPQNYLSFRDDLPANGLLAATFRSPLWPAALLALGTPALPLLMWKATARIFRRLASKLIQQAAAQINIDVTSWHDYVLKWQHDGVIFSIDNYPILATPITPRESLGFVLWIDNQYAALPPGEGLAYGNLESKQQSVLEIRNLDIARK